MGLLVWLPLNGNLKNQGLRNVTITNNPSAPTFADGKTGKGLSCSGSVNWKINSVTLGSEATICWWSKTTVNGKMAWVLESTASNKLNVYESTYYTLNTGDGNTNLFVTSSNANISVLHDGAWHHFAVTFGSSKAKLYIDGTYRGTAKTFRSPACTNGILKLAGDYNSGHSYDWNGMLGDFRVYDYCLSAREVREVSRGLIYHYKLEGSETPPVANLFAGTAMTPDVQATFVGNSSTEWNKPFRFYNGSAAIHTFSNTIPAEDTIKLNQKANLGIAFLRKATDIGLTSSSNYTISCKAKCTNASYSLCIGLSYYTTSNAWTWRGGTNAVSFGAANTWKTFTLTFKPDANTQYICYCFTVNANAATSHTFTIKECKLEKGSTATPWAPAVIDSIYEPPLTVDTGMDCSGFCRNGTIVGDITTVDPSPRYKNAISMDNTGTSNHIEADPIPCSDNIFSVSFWVKCAKSTNQVLVADPKISIGLLNSLLYVNPASAKPFTTTNFITDEWNHIVVIRNGSTWSAYINGVAETQSGSNNYYSHSASKLWLLNRNTNSNYAANASISDFRVYASVLSASDVMNLYNSPAFVDKGSNFGCFQASEVDLYHGVIKKNGISSFDYIERGTEASIYKQVAPNLLQGTLIDTIHYERVSGAGTETGPRFNPTEQLSTDTYYTFSAMVRGKANMNLYTINTGGNQAFSFINKADLDENKFKLFSITFKVTGDRTINQIYPCTRYGEANTEVGDWFEFESNSIKLEEGTKCTPWIPAVTDSGYRGYGQTLVSNQIIEI